MNRNFPPTVCLSLCLLVGPMNAQADSACGADAICPGISLSATYTGDVRHNHTGGMRKGGAYSGLLELGLSHSTPVLQGNARLTTSVAVMNTHGPGITGSRVGDLQGLNNVEAPAAWRLYELWSEFHFGATQGTAIRSGFMDLSAEFAAAATAGLFVSAPHGLPSDLAQTGANGPASWPVTGLGVRAAGSVSPAWSWKVGAYEGIAGDAAQDRFATVRVSRSEGALLIGEVSFASTHIAQVAVGHWRYTAPTERLLPGAGAATEGRGNRGTYAFIDAALGNHADIQWNATAHVGLANSAYQPIARYLGATLVASRFAAARADDAIGLAVAHATLGNTYRSLALAGGSPTTRGETIVEMSYRAQLPRGAALVPGVQWVRHPGALLGSRNSWVVGLRFELATERSIALAAQVAHKPNPVLANNEYPTGL